MAGRGATGAIPVLRHVPKEERLLYAVAVVLQSQSFSLRGMDLEKHLEILLDVNGSNALAQELCMELTHYGVTLGQLDASQVQMLLDEALDYAAASWQRFGMKMVAAQYPNAADLAVAFKRSARESGITNNLHLVDLRPAPQKSDVVGALWARTLQSMPQMSKEEVQQRLQMVAGQVHLHPPSGFSWALPLGAALLRLVAVPEGLIANLRHQILSRHHSISHVFDSRLGLPTPGSKGQQNMAKLLFEDFRTNFHQVMPDVDDDVEYERRLAALFAACDAHQDGAVDQEELQQALSIAAPPAGLSRMRTLSILQFGGWKAAWQSVGIGPEDHISVARFVALAANLDIAYEDAWSIFAQLSPTGDAISYQHLIHHGGDFTLHEFALRAWLACDSTTTLSDVAKRLQSPTLDGDLNMQTFRQVCGLSLGDSLGLDSSLGPSLGLTKGGLAPKTRVPSVKCQPPLTEGEVEAAYVAFKAKYHSVTLGAIRSELTSNTAFSDVLALDRISASIGETMVVRYRVPREMQAQLKEHSFIALVPSNMYWTSGGGGSWMLGRQTVTEMTGPKFALNRNGEGVVRLQVWPGVTALDLGAADLRIFSSPDAMAIGKQVGGSARFQLRPPAPARLMTEAASLTPTSIRLLWEAPHPPMTTRAEKEQHFRYVVRGKPIGLEIEQEADNQDRQVVWSHLKKKRMKYLSHEVNGLLPGVRYQFQVHSITDTGRRRSVGDVSPLPGTPSASPRGDGTASWGMGSFGTVAATPSGLESLASPGVEVTMPQRPAPPQPSHAILVERGLGGSFTLRWAEHEGRSMKHAWDYEVFWTVPDEEEFQASETAQLHADQEDQTSFGKRSAVWRYPLPVFLRKPGDGTVEGLLHPPEAEGVAVDGVRFCVRAVDPLSGATSLMSDLGPEVPLPSRAEAILRDIDAVNQIGEGAVRAGGFKRFLEDAEDAGLIGSDDSTGFDLRRQLYEKVESAGGLESMLEALADLQMKTFKEACQVVKTMQESTELTSEETPSWQHVVKLVAEAGGAQKFSRSLSSVELGEVLGHTQQLAALGIFQGKSADHTLRDALFEEDGEKRMPKLFSKIQEELGGLALDDKQVSDLSSALGIMARHRAGKGNWSELVELIAGEGGPVPVQPLVKYSEGHAKDLHAAMALSSLDAEGLIDFLKTAGEAEFIGQTADSAVRQDFLTKLSEAGGASVLYSSLQGIDLKALRPAMLMARAAKLHRESCLHVTAGKVSRADAWHQLVELIESKWGGPQGFLEQSGELYNSHRANAFERREENAFDGLVEQIGGRMAVSELLNLTASAGGVQHVLKALGPVNISQVCTFLESLRRTGGRFQDLEKLSAMVGEAGGLSRLVKSIEAKVQDTSKLAEIIEGGATFERHGFLDLPDKEREKLPEVLTKVMAETDLTRFLKVFDSVRLSSLLELVPLLVSAGALRSKGQPQNEDEVAAAGKSILRWLSSAGGSFLVCSAVYHCDARMFVKLMEQVNNMGLAQLRPASLSKVGAFLTDLSRRSGSLEDLVSMVGELDLLQVVSTLNAWRFLPTADSAGESLEDSTTEDATGSIENVRTEASVCTVMGPSMPEAKEVLDALEAMKLVAHKSGFEGIHRLVEMHQKVDTLERLEKGIELLESARLIKPWQNKGAAADHWQLVPEFEPWNHLVSLVNSFGGAERFNQRVEAVNLQHFDECVEFLDVAGLTSSSMKGEDSRFSDAIAAWKEVVRILVHAGGPSLFLESLQGIVVEDFLRVVGLLRQAGLARRGDEDEGADMTKRLSFTYGYGESAGRIRNEMLLDFVQRVIQAGGFHAFWHALKGVDLMKLKGDLHCLAVIRQKLQELIAEDWWLAVNDAEGLEELLHSHLAERKRRADDLTLRQRERLVKRFKEIGGVEAFLEGFNDINLSQMLAQHKALHAARIKDVSVIDALTSIGGLVKNKVDHLNGLQAVATTLVRWGDRHYRGEEPVRLWKAMHQQVTWLLMAIEENGALLKATVNHSNHPGKEPELTPARLAQFLQALRPVGGVPGFLSAFRGLDFLTAASQARILHDACVRSPETTKRLAVLYRLLRNSSTQLRGLEHFLRNFAAPVFAEAATQGSTAQDRLLVAERWQRLTAYLNQAAGRIPGGEEAGPPSSPASASGPDQVLEVLLLGLRLSEASGLKASKQDWEQLCQEIKNEPGLPGVLARLRGNKAMMARSPTARARAQTPALSASAGSLLVRTVLPPCFEEGHPDESKDGDDAPRAAPARPSDVKRRRPESAARSRASSVPEVLRTSPVPGWSPPPED